MEAVTNIVIWICAIIGGIPVVLLLLYFVVRVASCAFFDEKVRYLVRSLRAGDIDSRLLKDADVSSKKFN